VNELRIVLAVKPRLFSGALRQLLAPYARLKVMDAGCNAIDVLLAVRQHRADIVVATFEPATEIPPLATHLLAEFPNITVVAIGLGERRACTYRNPGESRILPEFSWTAIVDAIFSHTSGTSTGLPAD
jgi:hypothetical protein